MTGSMYNYKMLDESQVQYYRVAGVEELPEGERLFLEIGRRAIVVFNISGALFAIADVCSHDDGPVGDGEVDGYQVICPRHGAHFDIRTGQALTLPAVVDIPAYPVRTVDGQIEIGVPNEE